MKSVDQTDEDVAAILGLSTTSSAQGGRSLQSKARAAFAPGAIAAAATILVLAAVGLTNPFLRSARLAAQNKPKDAALYANVALSPRAPIIRGTNEAAPSLATGHASVLAAVNSAPRAHLRASLSKSQASRAAPSKPAEHALEVSELTAATPEISQASPHPILKTARLEEPVFEAFLGPNYAQTPAARVERIEATDALRLLRRR